MEVRNLEGPDQSFGLNLLKKRIQSIEVATAKFDLVKPTTDSWIIVNSILSNGMRLHFRATGANCSRLRAMFERFIRPNLVDSA